MFRVPGMAQTALQTMNFPTISRHFFLNATTGFPVLYTPFLSDWWFPYSQTRGIPTNPFSILARRLARAALERHTDMRASKRKSGKPSRTIEV